MKTAKELYKVNERYSWGSYQPIIDSFGTVFVQVDDADYQGDTRVLYRADNTYGYLCFGWGSCSGCDALQACDTIEQVDELIDQLRGQIKWFVDRQEALSFFRSHDWKGDYSYSQEFVDQCIGVLSDA
jgi:hypothetical protein